MLEMNIFMVSNLLGGSSASGSGGIYGGHANSASLEYEISNCEELSHSLKQHWIVKLQGFKNLFCLFYTTH